jgi:IS605 OrfB family transposase
MKYDVKAIVYEDLSNNFKKRNRDLNYEIHSWFYGKILNYLISIANWNGIATIYVDPKDTSKKCPNCNNELKEYNGNLHYLECKQCGFKDDRDHIAVANITKKFKELLLNPKGLEGEGLGIQPKTFLQAKYTR